MVAKESAKWREGRASVRIDVRSFSARGGKMPHTLDDDKGVAAEDDRNVVTPSIQRQGNP